MNKELEEILYIRYPALFAERTLPIHESSMCWGITCGDGWFDLIDALCATIQLGIDNDFTLPVTVTQIKEKCGSLRFHVRTGSKFGGNDWVRGAIDMTTMLSARVAQ